MPHNNPMVTALTDVIAEAVRLLRQERRDLALELLESVLSTLTRGATPARQGAGSEDEAA